MYQYSIKIAYLLSVLSVSIAFSTAPIAIVKPHAMISASNNYFTPLNDSFDIYKYKTLMLHQEFFVLGQL